MNNTIKPEIGIFILRISLGIVLIAHSLYLKVFVFTLPGTADFFASLGLPSALAYLVFAIEAIAGVALILGYKTRWFAAATVPVLLGATWAHLPSGWLFSNSGGGWEYPLFLTLSAVVLFFMGDGAYAFKPRNQKEA